MLNEAVIEKLDKIAVKITKIGDIDSYIVTNCDCTNGCTDNCYDCAKDSGNQW